MNIPFNVSDHAQWAHQSMTQFIQQNSGNSNGLDAKLADLEMRLADFDEAINIISTLDAYDEMKKELVAIQKSFNEIKGQLPVTTVQDIEEKIRKSGNRLITEVSPRIPQPPRAGVLIGDSKEITPNNSHTISVRDLQSPQQGTPMPNDSENIHIHIHATAKKFLMESRL